MKVDGIANDGMINYILLIDTLIADCSADYIFWHLRKVHVNPYFRWSLGIELMLVSRQPSCRWLSHKALLSCYDFLPGSKCPYQLHSVIAACDITTTAHADLVWLYDVLCSSYRASWHTDTRWMALKGTANTLHISLALSNDTFDAIVIYIVIACCQCFHTHHEEQLAYKMILLKQFVKVLLGKPSLRHIRLKYVIISDMYVEQ